MFGCVSFDVGNVVIQIISNHMKLMTKCKIDFLPSKNLKEGNSTGLIEKDCDRFIRVTLIVFEDIDVIVKKIIKLVLSISIKKL